MASIRLWVLSLRYSFSASSNISFCSKRPMVTKKLLVLSEALPALLTLVCSRTNYLKPLSRMTALIALRFSTSIFTVGKKFFRSLITLILKETAAFELNRF